MSSSSPSTGRKAISAPVARNARGGVLVREEALRVAWDFFDTRGTGRINANDLKQRLVPFNSAITSKELKFLLNNQSEITFQELYALLRDNQLATFDPAAEAFKWLNGWLDYKAPRKTNKSFMLVEAQMYDTRNTGYVDLDKVKEFFEEAGYGKLSDDDMKAILKVADADGDGRIGLEDFRKLVIFQNAYQNSGLFFQIPIGQKTVSSSEDDD